jgi:two-component system phosphate regulon sensor histidine kinase PhoR
VAGRIERELRLEEGDIEGCVNQALHDVSPFLREKEIFVDIQLDPPEQGMLMETQQIEQLLINLLENACKFTPRRGTIEIRGCSVFWDPLQADLDDSALAPNSYRIEIHDSGPGIPASVLHSIFEEYTSYSGANDRSAGLGLAICKLIVNSHGGKIWAASSKGAAFFVILPFEPRRGLGRPGAKGEVEKLSRVVAG